MAETQFAALETGREVAYKCLTHSAGPTLVHVPSGMTPIEVIEEDPPYERFLRTLGGYGSLIAFDHLGKGASDPFDPDLDFVDQLVDCFVAVLDACEADRAWLVVDDTAGAPLARRAATHHRERLSGAAVLNPPGGVFLLDADTIVSRDDPSNEVLRTRMPSRADDPAFQAWHERAGRLGGSATAARALLEAGERSAPRVIDDVEELADPPPFLLLYRSERVPAEIIDLWRERLSGTQILAIPGSDATFNSSDAVLIADTVGEFITGERRVTLEDRPLVALLFLDLVASTESVARLGDAAWTAALDGYEQAVEDRVARHGGAVVKHTGDGTLATFPTASRALAAASSTRGALGELGLEARFGVHVGEVETRGEDIGGFAVHLAARVMGDAGSGEILVTSTVVGSVIGGPERFEGLGVRELKGIDQPWELHVLMDR